MSTNNILLNIFYYLSKINALLKIKNIYKIIEIKIILCYYV